jgi:hypothetical protein
MIARRSNDASGFIADFLLAEFREPYSLYAWFMNAQHSSAF